MKQLLKHIPEGSFIVLCSDGSGAMYDDARFPSGDSVKAWDNLDEMQQVLHGSQLTKLTAVQLLENASLTLGERLALQQFIREYL
jgi:hypothetical protein